MMKKIKLNTLIFELTNDCNQQCKFCYNHWKGTKEKVSAPKSSFSKTKKVLKEIFKQAEITSVSFSGGEPMLLPKIHDLALYSRFHHAFVSVLSNGTLLTDNDIESFIDLGISHLQIPILSSDASVHDSLTQHKNAWKKSIANVEKILMKKPDLFNAVLVLTKQNIACLEKSLQFYAKLGVHHVLLNRFNIGGLGRAFKNELALTHDELRWSFSVVNAFAKEHSIRFYSGVCTPICVLDPAEYPNIAFSFCNKNVSQRPITINFEGNVRFCNHSPRVLGNIFERDLQSILFKDEYDAYFNTVPDFCASCELLKLCGGGCRAASEQVYKSFSKVDPLMDI